jgi:hypothetical protein
MRQRRSCTESPKPREGTLRPSRQLPFGYGLVCWGMVLAPELPLHESNGALQKMGWHLGARGLRAERGDGPIVRGRWRAPKTARRGGPGSGVAGRCGDKSATAGAGQC